MKLSQAPAQVINYSSPECLFLRRSQYWVCVYPKASLSLFGPLVAWACYFPLNSEMRCTQLKICIVFSHKLKRTLNKRGLDPLWLPVFPLCLSCSPCWFWPNASSWWLEQLYCSSWFFPTVDISGILTTKCRRGEIDLQIRLGKSPGDATCDGVCYKATHNNLTGSRTLKGRLILSPICFLWTKSPHSHILRTIC